MCVHVCVCVCTCVCACVCVCVYVQCDSEITRKKWIAALERLVHVRTVRLYVHYMYTLHVYTTCIHYMYMYAEEAVPAHAWVPHSHQ